MGGKFNHNLLKKYKEVGNKFGISLFRCEKRGEI